ncbi:MAG: cation:proton antiporter, partial [Campylobacterota bacterium]|nr:cation:proton antiporter [Campylobacterota bacterium]
TFLILLGVVVGPNFIGLLPKEFITDWFSTITTIALGMVGFLLGQQFTVKAIKKIGKQVLYIAIGKVVLTFVFVSTALFLIGVSLDIALVLGSIATATAPAAVYETVHELKIKNQFSKKLLSVVAFDDILGLLLFSLVLAFIGLNGNSSAYELILNGIVEIFGSLFIGFVLGYPIAKITGRLTNGEPIMIEALASVFVICGVAMLFDLSTILASMALGSAVATFGVHHKTAFHAIKHIEWPFMVIFFLLAGATLDIDSFLDIGYIGIVYIILRIIGIYIGSRVGGVLSDASDDIKNWMGLSLLPQAGVAIGMALMATQKLESSSGIVLSMILGTTVFFEIIGPIVTRYVLKKIK